MKQHKKMNSSAKCEPQSEKIERKHTQTHTQTQTQLECLSCLFYSVKNLA